MEDNSQYFKDRGLIIVNKIKIAHIFKAPMFQALCLSSIQSPRQSSRGRHYHYPHFVDKEMEVQRD